MSGGVVDVEAMTREQMQAWFRNLQDCVRRVDYTSAVALFAADVASFGTHAEVVTGLEALRASQWSNVWPNIEDFTFDIEQVHGGSDGAGGWAMAPWTSTGFDEQGAPFDRPGRATVTFARRDGTWLAVHTHFSLNPGTPPRTYGRKRG
jgi:ketosteroid isomerase-like protein